MTDMTVVSMLSSYLLKMSNYSFNFGEMWLEVFLSWNELSPLCDTKTQTWQRSDGIHHLSSALLFWEMRQTNVIGWLTDEMYFQWKVKRKWRGRGKGKVARWKDIDPLKIPSIQWQMHVSTWSSPHWEAGSIKWHLIGSGYKQKLSGKMSASGRELLIWQNKGCIHKQTPFFAGIRRRNILFSGLYKRAE